jgi:hypothetical protein
MNYAVPRFKNSNHTQKMKKRVADAPPVDGDRTAITTIGGDGDVHSNGVGRDHHASKKLKAVSHQGNAVDEHSNADTVDAAELETVFKNIDRTLSILYRNGQRSTWETIQESYESIDGQQLTAPLFDLLLSFAPQLFHVTAKKLPNSTGSHVCIEFPDVDSASVTSSSSASSQPSSSDSLTGRITSEFMQKRLDQFR